MNGIYFFSIIWVLALSNVQLSEKRELSFNHFIGFLLADDFKSYCFYSNSSYDKNKVIYLLNEQGEIIKKTGGVLDSFDTLAYKNKSFPRHPLKLPDSVLKFEGEFGFYPLAVQVPVKYTYASFHKKNMSEAVIISKLLNLNDSLISLSGYTFRFESEKGDFIEVSDVIFESINGSSRYVISNNHDRYVQRIHLW